MKVTKEMTFDAAHMLSNYQGKCMNLHGHTYRVQATLVGDIRENGNEQGMVVDFNTLKEFMEAIIKPLDHAILFSDNKYRSAAEDELKRWAEKFDMSFAVIPDGKSTSENIALYIKQKIKSHTGYDSFVKVWETPTSFAEA